MKKQLKKLQIVGFVVLLISLALACQHDPNNILLSNRSQQSSQVAQDNSSMITSAQDVVNTTAGAFASQGLTFGRFAESSEGDDSECKPIITNTIKIDRTNPDSIIVSGKIIIDFGNGATCPDSLEMKKGKIIDSIYVVLSKTTHKSSELITFQNYWRDSTQLDGSISITSATGSPTIVKINGTKVRYRDGSSSSWTGDLTFTYQRSGVGNTYISSMALTGSWSGTTRNGTNFSANITKEVDFKAGCFGHRHKFTPVSGTIDIVTNGVLSTIDYGDGTCDRVYTITTAGTTTQHHLG